MFFIIRQDFIDSSLMFPRGFGGFLVIFFMKELILAQDERWLWLTHASRTMKPSLLGGLVANG